MNTKRRPWRLTAIVVLVLLMALPSVAMAKKGPPTGGELTNNLSVPAIFVGGNPFGLTCPSGPTDPSGDPITGYPIDTTAYYWVQGVHTWQAQCATMDVNTIEATAAWGDNLAGGEGLKAGSPIRVEVGLTTTVATAMTGYTVVKLDPAALDRESAYGTLATPTGTGTYTATQTPFIEDVRAYAPATFSIYNETTEQWVVPEQAMTAEINSTGAVVYGYNWGVGGHGVKSLPTAGDYTLTFTVPTIGGLPAINITGVNAGTLDAATDTITLQITLSPKNNGGGGGGHGGGPPSR